LANVEHLIDHEVLAVVAAERAVHLVRLVMLVVSTASFTNRPPQAVVSNPRAPTTVVVSKYASRPTIRDLPFRRHRGGPAWNQTWCELRSHNAVKAPKV
jgi:hypothetical protein